MSKSLFVVLSVVVAHISVAQIWGQGAPVTQVIVHTPARYQLLEGIGVAITNVTLKGKVVTFATVMNELHEMQRAHDVKLPYSFDITITSTTRGSKTKTKSSAKLSAENRKRKAEFEALVKRRIAALTPDAKQLDQNSDMGILLEPEVKKFKDRDSFIKAYVEFKMDLIDDEIREKYAKKLGGLSQYKRDMKNEAARLWKESKL